MTNNHKTDVDSPCAFAEMLVSVLYGEASAIERREFNQHALTCTSCQEELAAFGAVRSAIGEYRESEFSLLATPQIILPNEKKAIARKNQQFSWLDRLRKFVFPANNYWVPGATAVAGFLICAALLFVFGSAIIDKSSNPQIAQSEPTLKTPVNNTHKANNNLAVASLPESNELQQNQPKAAAPATMPITPASPKAKATASSPRSAARRNQTQEASKPKLPTTPSEISREPLNLSFEPDELEEDAPRLSDLFEEIGSVE